MLSTARGRVAPGAVGRCASPGRAAECGCMPAGRGMEGPAVGVPQLGDLPALPAAPTRPQVGAPGPCKQPLHPYISLDFLGERKFLLSTSKKKKKKNFSVFLALWSCLRFVFLLPGLPRPILIAHINGS